MKTIWKASVCIVAVLLSFSIYSCGDDDDETVGSRDLLLGTWNGVYYLSQEWEDGEKVSDSKEEFCKWNQPLFHRVQGRRYVCRKRCLQLLRKY